MTAWWGSGEVWLCFLRGRVGKNKVSFIWVESFQKQDCQVMEGGGKWFGWGTQIRIKIKIRAVIRDAEAILCVRTRSGVGNCLFLSAANKRFFKRASDIFFFLFSLADCPRFSLFLSFPLLLIKREADFAVRGEREVVSLQGRRRRLYGCILMKEVGW